MLNPVEVVAGQTSVVAINRADEHGGVTKHDGYRRNVTPEPPTGAVRFHGPARHEKRNVALLHHACLGPHNLMPLPSQIRGNEVSSTPGAIDGDAQFFWTDRLLPKKHGCETFEQLFPLLRGDAVFSGKDGKGNIRDPFTEHGDEKLVCWAGVF